MTKIAVGLQAPDFSASDQNGKIHTLRDYYGKWLLLYFYPRDFTSGCTTEACSLRDNFETLNNLVTIVGVSGDSKESRGDGRIHLQCHPAYCPVQIRGYCPAYS